MSITSDQIRTVGFIHGLADDAADEIEELEKEVAALKAERDELLFALKLLYEDMLDYGRRNNLGGEDNHVFVVARVAIAKAEGGKE